MRRIPHVSPFAHAVMATTFLVVGVLYAVTDVPLARSSFVLGSLALAVLFGSLWAYETTERELRGQIAYMRAAMQIAYDRERDLGARPAGCGCCTVVDSVSLNLLTQPRRIVCRPCRDGAHEQCRRTRRACSCGECGPQGPEGRQGATA